MWPWVSSAFAYLCYSIVSHLRYGESPTGTVVILAAAASILPDLIDKPLAWQYGLFASGYALGHSVFSSLAVLAVASALARRFDRPRWGLAVGVGFLSHNVGDVLQALPDEGVRGAATHVLWPLVQPTPRAYPGFRGTLTELLAEYLDHLRHLDVTSPFGAVLAVGALTLLLWAYDGFPVLREVVTGWRHEAR